jgi:hypothetical protein
LRIRPLGLMLVLVGLAAMGSANAAWVMDSVLTGGLGSLDLHSTVDYDGSIYTYTYVLTATDVISPVHHFDVGNPDQLEFADATNTGALYDFDNPVYQDWLTSVLWSYGEIVPTGTATFSYTSVYAPTEGDVTATDTGNRAMGRTYVMMVPEPTTIGGLGVLLLGLAGAFRRRTK